MSAEAKTHDPTDTQPSRAVALTYSVSIGLAALAILLQGLWAGLFIHEGEDYKDSWVKIHARGADLAIVLTIVAFVVAVAKLRHRKDLVIGTGALAVLLILEAYLGGLIGDSPNVTAIHIPLAMALVALSVWLPMRAGRLVSGSRSTTSTRPPARADLS